MIQSHKTPQGKTLLTGNNQDLEFASVLTRARLYGILGKDQGETYFKKLPAFGVLSGVSKELLALQDT
jgi:hypothetical protein